MTRNCEMKEVAGKVGYRRCAGIRIGIRIRWDWGKGLSAKRPAQRRERLAQLAPPLRKANSERRKEAVQRRLQGERPSSSDFDTPVLLGSNLGRLLSLVDCIRMFMYSGPPLSGNSSRALNSFKSQGSQASSPTRYSLMGLR